MNITAIQSKVMLCSVTISTWVARRYDGKATEEVEKSHQAKGIGRFNKRLLPEHAPSFAEVRDARQPHPLVLLRPLVEIRPVGRAAVADDDLHGVRREDAFVERRIRLGGVRLPD